MKKILVVDDRVGVLKIIGRFLCGKNLDVSLSDSPGKALRLCERMRFDLVISDFDLGEGTGIELICKIRKTQPKIKTILMSGNFNFDEEMIKTERIDAFLRKPFDAEKLREVIGRIFDG